MSDLVVRCRAEIDRHRTRQDNTMTLSSCYGGGPVTYVAEFSRSVLDAFTAILDEHHEDDDKGGDCAGCLMGSWPCVSVAAVAAALGVGDQETQP